MDLDLMAFIVAGLTVATAALVILAVRTLVTRSGEQLAHRLGVVSTTITSTVATTAPEPGQQVRSVLERALAPFAALARDRSKDERGLIRRLAMAGLRRDSAPTLFLAAKLLLAAGGLAGFLWYASRRPTPIDYAFVWAIAVFTVAYYAPDLWLTRRIRSRQIVIERGLPDTLDLLVTCVEAGLGLDQAMQRVSGEIALAWPVLASELRLTFLEVSAGMARSEALRRLAARTGVGDLKSLAATLNQTEIFGTSIGTALRIQATSIRIRRMHRAEERAAIVSVKMMVPLVVCILPALIAIIIGPAVVSIIRNLFPVFGGQ